MWQVDMLWTDEPTRALGALAERTPSPVLEDVLMRALTAGVEEQRSRTYKHYY